jgi:hypothetical protein
MSAMKPKPLPTATALAVEGHVPSERLCLYFKTADSKTNKEPVAIGLKPPEVKELLHKMAMHLAAAPLPSFQAAAQSFGVRGGLDAILVGQTPTLKYDLECGLTLQTTIDVSELRRFRDRANEVLEFLDSLGPAPLQ